MAPSLRDLLGRMARDYVEAARPGDPVPKDDPVVVLFRTEGPRLLRGMLPDGGAGLEVKGSPGVGRWAHVPWLSILAPRITRSTTRGVYVSYLFPSAGADEGERLVLSLQFGVSQLRERLGDAVARMQLRVLVAAVRGWVPNLPRGFSAERVSLVVGGQSGIPAFYEEAHAFGRAYNTARLPGETDLQNDLRNMLALYRAVCDDPRLLTLLPDATTSADDADGKEAGYVGTEDRRRFRNHRRIERNRRLVKETKAYWGDRCQACGFAYAGVYGEIGRGYIEAHHKEPISRLTDDAPLREYDPKTDMTVLCADCHRMAHHMKPPDYFDAFLAVAECRRRVVGEWLRGKGRR